MTLGAGVFYPGQNGYQTYVKWATRGNAKNKPSGPERAPRAHGTAACN